MNKKSLSNIILIGGGGHCMSVIDVIETTKQYNIKGIIDSDSRKSEVLGYPILGGDEKIPELVNDSVFFLITVGQIKSPSIRKKIAFKLESLGANIATIISPLSYVSKHAKINKGSIVMHHAVVNALSIVGHHCIINTKANIEHGAIVNDFCHISTGAIVNGDSIIGSESFIGSNATISNGITIENNSIISAGKFVK